MKNMTIRAMFLGLAVALTPGFSLAFKQGAYYLSKPNHQDITDDALRNAHVVLPNWLQLGFSPAASKIIQDQNANTDKEHFSDSEFHFDAETFNEAKSNIITWRAIIIERIKSGEHVQAQQLLGTALHTIQDFYAHSNWIEINETWKKSGKNYPHPAWSTTDPFADPAFSTPLPPGSKSAIACNVSAPADNAPLTTGYFHNLMVTAEKGFSTNPWIDDIIHLDLPRDRCVHGNDKVDAGGLNKDQSERRLFAEARAAATFASGEFVNGVLEEAYSGLSLYTNICDFLGQSPELCLMSNIGAASVNTVKTIESDLYAGMQFTVRVEGSELSRFLTVTMDGDGNCQTPFDGSKIGFYVRCFSMKEGSHTITVLNSLGNAIGNATVTLGPQNARSSGPIVALNASVKLWAENLYSNVVSAVWQIADYATDKVVAVKNGIAEILTVAFSFVGDKAIQVFYRDSNNQNVGTSVLSITVDAGNISATAEVTKVLSSSGADIPNNGTTAERRPNFSGTISAPLPNQFYFVEILIDGTTVGHAVTTGSAWTYTTISDLAVGPHTVTARVARGDGVFGTQSTAWRLTVLPSSTSQLFDEFTGTTIDTSTWTIDGWGGQIGPVNVSGGVAQFGALGRISTRNKVTLSGNKIVIEARMAGQGPSRDTSILLADVASGDYLYSGDTNYCGWGLFASANGGYELTSGAFECGGSNKVKHVGTSTNAFMEYRWTIVGNQLTVERGTTLANVTETLTATLGRSIDGRSFYLSIGTAGPSYSPGTWDWVRVNTQSSTSAQASYSLGGDFSPTSNPSGSWTYGWSATLGGPLNLFDTTNSPVIDRPYPGLSFWRANRPYSLWIVKNTGAAVISDGWINIAPGDIHMSPGLNNEYAIARWKATVAGSYRVQGRFALYEAGGTVDVHVFKNGVQLDGALLQTAATKERTFNLAVNVAVDDLIDFVVGNAGDGHVGDDPIVSVSIVPQ